MKFINVSYDGFIKNIDGRKVIQFGVSSAWNYFLNVFPTIAEDVLDSTLFIVDNSSAKQGKKFEIGGRKFCVESPEKIKEYDGCVVLITVALAYQKDICIQLLGMELPDDMECYSLQLMTWNFMENDNSCVSGYFASHKTRVNVPIIHSFWFSGEAKSELYKRCIDSWHRFCPDFEIIEWNADNYDVTKNKYMFEAFKHGKWAFVSDYARLDVVYRQGGIYMDMDVELIAPIGHLLNADSFFFRQEDGFLELGSGFGAAAGNRLIGGMLRTYEGRSLILENGVLDRTPQPQWLNGMLKSCGIDICHDSQVIGDCLIMSNDYIACSAGSGSVRDAELGIHWHNGGWLEERERELIRKSFDARHGLVAEYFNGTR